MKTQNRPLNGRLIYVENVSGRTVTISIGSWALLQHKKRILTNDPQYRNGKLKIAYL